MNAVSYVNNPIPFGNTYLFYILVAIKYTNL